MPTRRHPAGSRAGGKFALAGVADPPTVKPPPSMTMTASRGDENSEELTAEDFCCRCGVRIFNKNSDCCESCEDVDPATSPYDLWAEEAAESPVGWW